MGEWVRLGVEQSAGPITVFFENLRFCHKITFFVMNILNVFNTFWVIAVDDNFVVVEFLGKLSSLILELSWNHQYVYQNGQICSV